MLEQIRIVLVGTSHTGNIGSVARAMKTMGLNDLRLVEPKTKEICMAEEAVSLASGATGERGTHRRCSSRQSYRLSGPLDLVRLCPWPKKPRYLRR